MLSDANKYLTVRKGVLLTPSIDAAIYGLDPFFEKLPSQVTSGKRSEVGQLNLIKQFAVEHKLHNEIPGFLPCAVDSKTTFGNKQIYTWQVTWSRLLSIGIKINPPVAAKVLFDYIADGRNKMGEEIKPSEHIRGVAFDISGKNGTHQIVSIIETAMKTFKLIRGYREEHTAGQLCVHVSCV